MQLKAHPLLFVQLTRAVARGLNRTLSTTYKGTSNRYLSQTDRSRNRVGVRTASFERVGQTAALQCRHDGGVDPRTVFCRAPLTPEPACLLTHGEWPPPPLLVVVRAGSQT